MANSVDYVVMTPEAEVETQRMVTVLRTAMKLLGLTNRDLERKLGLSSSYLSRLFSGMMVLRYEHIVDLARAMGLEPAEILYFAYPEAPSPPSEAAGKIREAMRRFSAVEIAPLAVPKPASLPAEEVEKAVAKMFRRFLAEMAKDEAEPGR